MNRAAVKSLVEAVLSEQQNSPDWLKHHIEKAGHKHLSSNYYNRHSKHHYNYNHGGTPFGKLATEHGFHKITDDLYKKFGADRKQTDYLQIKKAGGGHRIEHGIEDPFSVYVD